MESGPSIWLLLLTVGAAALGAALAFGIYRNKQRTPQEKALTEAATRRQYQAEDRDSS